MGGTGLEDSPSSFYFRLRRSGFSRFPVCGFLIPSFYLFIYACDLKVLAPPACSSLLLLPSFCPSLTQPFFFSVLFSLLTSSYLSFFPSPNFSFLFSPTLPSFHGTHLNSILSSIYPILLSFFLLSFPSHPLPLPLVRSSHSPPLASLNLTFFSVCLYAPLTLPVLPRAATAGRRE